MDPKLISTDQTKLLEGISLMSEIVGSTLGPNGRNVIYDTNLDFPSVTKDGVTVARHMNSIDREVNMGMMLVREAAEKSVEQSGDGTTTSIVLTEALVRKGKELLKSHSAAAIKESMLRVAKVISEKIKQRSIKIDKDFDRLQQIAKISSNGDDNIAYIIASCFEEVGLDGAINVLRSRNEKTYAEITAGFKFDRGYQFPEFVNVEGSMQVQYENPRFLIYRENVSQVRELQAAVNYCMENKEPLIVIADNYERHVIDQIIRSLSQGVQVALVKTPGFGDDLRILAKDIATLVGAASLTFAQLNNIKGDDWDDVLGRSENITITSTETIISGGDGNKDKIESRKKGIRVEIKDAPDEYRKSRHKERLSMMNSGLATIRVGSPSEVALKEKIDRVDDALGATKAAIQEGYLPGAGKALVEIADDLKSELDAIGLDFIDMEVMDAFYEPFLRILRNGGMKIDFLKDIPLISKNFGYNENHELVNLIESGIIDPAKVTRCAVENAASVASTIITTSAIISLIPLTQNK